MVRKSYGKMRGTRKKLCRMKRSIARCLDEYKTGETVTITFGSHRIPHPKFHGLTGRIIGKKGESYVVQVRNKKSLKTIFLRPEHLRR